MQMGRVEFSTRQSPTTSHALTANEIARITSDGFLEILMLLRRYRSMTAFMNLQERSWHLSQRSSTDAAIRRGLWSKAKHAHIRWPQFSMSMIRNH